MLGKQRLIIGIPYGQLSIDLPAWKWKDLIWVVVPPLVLALTFLSFVLLQEPAKGPMSIDGPEVVSPPVVEELFSYYPDWRQTDGSYLSPQPVLR